MAERGRTRGALDPGGHRGLPDAYAAVSPSSGVDFSCRKPVG